MLVGLCHLPGTASFLVLQAFRLPSLFFERFTCSYNTQCTPTLATGGGVAQVLCQSLRISWFPPLRFWWRCRNPVFTTTIITSAMHIHVYGETWHWVWRPNKSYH